MNVCATDGPFSAREPVTGIRASGDGCEGKHVCAHVKRILGEFSTHVQRRSFSYCIDIVQLHRVPTIHWPDLSKTPLSVSQNLTCQDLSL